MKKGKFVIVHRKFGYDMFISSTKCDVSDKVEGALVFDYSQDNPEIKVAAYVRSTGFDGWEARPLAAELTVERVSSNLEFMLDLLNDTGGEKGNPKLAADIVTANNFLAGNPISEAESKSLREFIACAEGES